MLIKCMEMHEREINAFLFPAMYFLIIQAIS